MIEAIKKTLRDKRIGLRAEKSYIYNILSVRQIDRNKWSKK